MPNSTDLTFITNEPDHSLLDRFKVLIKDTRFFDVLVGYFFSSGFFNLYKSLEPTEKIRILIGINTDRKIVDSLTSAQQLQFEYSGSETKQAFSSQIVTEMEQAPDTKDTEEGINKFVEWIISGKMEIRAYPSSQIHSKLYIMTFAESDRDLGRVITGSSNFTKSGLVDNLEFNVELKNPSDYTFAKDQFDNLWKVGVDVSDKYIATIKENTWLNDTITPYELYLKFLYEYFKDELSDNTGVNTTSLPQGFKKLEYQEQAVKNAKRILEEYGGVFISDVVGLGKTYMSALLASQLPGNNLVLAAPVLLDKDNPGSWPNVFYDFRVVGEYESLGKLDKIIKRGTDKYDNVFIDEAHKFRTEDNATYEKLAQICRGKRVILVTATPYNNTLKDILSQIKLFQNSKKSTIPNLPNLELFFSGLEKRLKGLDRKNNYQNYMEVVKQNAEEVREKLLKYLMVRRTRTEVQKYFGKDLKKQGLAFPQVDDPQPIYYQFSESEEKIFTGTISLLTQDFKYARYTPLLPEYYKGKDVEVGEQAQKNVGKFMKILLVKRLESSFYAFRQSLERSISSYSQFIKEFDNGSVYISDNHLNKIFDLLEDDDDQQIQQLLDADKAKKLPAKDFDPKFADDLRSDLAVLEQIYGMWGEVDQDPKLLEFVERLRETKVLSYNKLIIFTESRETGQYLRKNLETALDEKILFFHGSSKFNVRDKVIDNFDAKSSHPSDDYRILIATEVLSEGVNLHRSNVVINYDIPWNPTRLMQRVGRINRVDTRHSRIYTFNFFPTKAANSEIKLKEAAQAKIIAFIEMLGNDAKLLTDGEEIKQHDLVQSLFSKETLTGENEKELSPLKYLRLIEHIRESDPSLFEHIKQLPKKARTARKTSESTGLLTYFRKGKLQKFYLSSKAEVVEKPFLESAALLECPSSAKRLPTPPDLYDHLDKNMKEFEQATIPDMPQDTPSRGRDSSVQLLRILKAFKDKRQLTDQQEEYLDVVKNRLMAGSLPKQTASSALKEVKRSIKDTTSLLTIIAVLQTTIPPELLEKHIAESSANVNGPREVILSEYLVGAQENG